MHTENRGHKLSGEEAKQWDTKHMVTTTENIESIQELVFSQESPVHIDQSMKLQEKPTKIIIVI